MNKIVKDALVLMAFSLVLGFVLGGVYKITEEPIRQAAIRKEMAAYKVVFDNADSFVSMEVDVAKAEALMTAGGFRDVVNSVSKAVDASGNVIGHVVSITTKDGFSGGIVLIVGIQNDGTISGVQHTSVGGETLDTAFKPEYIGQFEGIKTDKFEKGTNLSYDSVTGATMSADAIKNAVNAAIVYVNDIKGGAQ